MLLWPFYMTRGDWRRGALFKPVVFSSVQLYNNNPKPRQEHKAVQLKSLHVQTGLWHTPYNQGEAMHVNAQRNYRKEKPNQTVKQLV